MRFAAGVEYNGTGFCGWQSQVGVATVQDAVENALSKIADHRLRVIAAGRTDAGVHAFGQVIHFDTSSHRSQHAWLRGTNSRLPAGVSLLWVKSVDSDFHARFSAEQRAYRYVILNRNTPSAVHHQLAYVHYLPLDTVQMQSAAELLIGRHDFTAYRAASCQSKNAVRDLRHLSVRREREWITIDVVADGFLHHMVRNIAGVLIRIGMGFEPANWARQVLESRDRRLAGITAPACGLYLTSVSYDPCYGLPSPTINAVFW